MTLDLPDIQAAQDKVNRAVSRWAMRRTETEGKQVDVDLFGAFRQFREVCEAAFMEAARTNPQVIGIVNPAPPDIAWNPKPSRYDTATELRIANLLHVAEYPTSLGVAAADSTRRDARRQALLMMGLITQEVSDAIAAAD